MTIEEAIYWVRAYPNPTIMRYRIEEILVAVAQGIETRSAETERLSPKGESPVAKDAPNHDGAS
jgi:hypothetical protein